MQKTQLIHSLFQIGAVKFGEFVLKSGKTSSIYLDLRQIVSHPQVLKLVATVLWEQISSQQFDLICGVPYTALPIATCISIQQNIPMIMRRKEKKDYGTKQQIEGSFRAGQRCLIIEDVITSGASILETVDDLTAAGLQIQDAVVLVNREQGGKENLQKKQINISAALTLKEILTELHSSTLLKDDEIIIVKKLISELA